MIPQSQPKKKKNSSKANLVISAIFHGILVGVLFYFAAKEGLLGKKVQKIAVEMVKEKKPEPEKPKPEPPKIEPPKVEPPKMEAPKVETAKAPPTGVRLPAPLPPCVSADGESWRAAGSGSFWQVSWPPSPARTPRWDCPSSARRGPNEGSPHSSEP